MKNEGKKIGICFPASLAVLLLLISAVPCVMAGGNGGKLWLEPSPSTYVDDSDDAWLHESYVTTATFFDLNITNHNAGDICHLYLLVAVDRDPAGNVTVKVDGSTVGPYDGTIKPNNKALVEETDPDYEYPGHGVYIYGSSVHFAVVEIKIPDDGKLIKGETITVPVEIIPTSTVKVHFDAVGANDSNAPIAFVPPSHDATYTTSEFIPEFATIAIPFAATIGLFIFFNRKRKQ
ncbi:choice-of-anchor N protein [Candidatus Alkanophaga liquidiphilum]